MSDPETKRADAGHLIRADFEPYRPTTTWLGRHPFVELLVETSWITPLPFIYFSWWFAGLALAALTMVTFVHEAKERRAFREWTSKPHGLSGEQAQLYDQEIKRLVRVKEKKEYWAARNREGIGAAAMMGAFMGLRAGFRRPRGGYFRSRIRPGR